MWFDLTKDVRLTEGKYELYKKLQTSLYAVALLIAVAMAFIIIFDSQNFQFSFLSPNSSSNNINFPQYRDMGSVIEDRKVKAGDKIYFSAVPAGIFSAAVVEFSIDEGKEDLTGASITVRRSHQAFLYPKGTPFGFKNGTLLKNNNDRYIVSGGALRKIQPSSFASLGYSSDAFMEVSEEELQYNAQGQPVESSTDYPDNSIFRINDEYYVLENSRLKKFSSEQAFLSQYKPIQAITKDESIFSKYPQSENLISFGDGSLVSYGDSIYILSDGKYFPIDSPETFLEKEYVWDDVVPVSPDEIALYEKAPLFTIRRSHPDGTIFKTDESGEYYIAKGFEKHLLPSQKIAESWMNISPIMISERSLQTAGDCKFGEEFLDSYSCEIDIGSLQSIDSTNYEFILQPDEDVRLESIDISFQKNINRKNLSVFLKDIFNKIRNKYVSKNIPGL